MATYKGKYNPKNPGKYRGDLHDIVYRSSWERGAFKWLDENDKVVAWSSEGIVVPYYCRSDGKAHRYFVDLWIKFDSGRTMMVEIKPASQIAAPKPTKTKKGSRYLAEVLTYGKNISKWQAAKKYAEERKWEFFVWDENSLRALGIQIL